jgi:hypothetical protein
MSIRVMTRVWDLSAASGGELLVLLALADFADDDGYSYPTPAQVAEKARLSDRQVRTVLASLEERGELAYHIGRGRSPRSWFAVLTGLDEPAKAVRRRGLEERINRQSLPDLSPHFRKKLPEITSGFRRKSGSLQQLNPEVSSLNPEVSSNENAVSQLPDASNDVPNRHDPSYDPSDPPPPTPSGAASIGRSPAPAAPAGGGGGNPPPGAAYLLSQGFGAAAAEAFGGYPVDVLSAEIARYRRQGTGPGGIVKAWRISPPGTPPPSSALPPSPVSIAPILAHPDPKVRERWARKFRAEGADRAAVLAAYLQEYPDAVRDPPPARTAPAVRP